MSSKVDVLIVGGGLAGGLAALRFLSAKPDLKVLLLERSDRLGGNHTWSFHNADLSEESLLWIQPLIGHTWSRHEVRFPKFTRVFETAYSSIRSDDFHRELIERLGASVRLKAEVRKISGSSATLANGEVIHAHLVLDARGIEKTPPPKMNGYQKFIGFDLVLEEPHGLTTPILKDATCPQLDGYRFFYVLPWDERRLLIEETFYSDSPTLNADRIKRSIVSYAERRGWKIKAIEREEAGVLPIPMTANYIQTALDGEAIPIGSRAGYFHATTGYSLPDAVRMAEFLTSLPEPSTESARQALVKWRRPWLSRQRFYRLLNRMLFFASEPSLRYLVLQKFYELPDDVVQRFYSGRSTWGDRIRLLTGKPPVALHRALQSLSEKTIIARGGGVS